MYTECGCVSESGTSNMESGLCGSGFAMFSDDRSNECDLAIHKDIVDEKE